VIIVDDDEFTCCQYCQSNLRQYHNTSLSHTPSTDHHYTRTLLGHGHLNCEKCGVFVPIHPEDPNEEGLIFVCSAETPHPHCLCYECGELYQVAGSTEDEEKNDIVTQLMTDDGPQSTESCSTIGSDTACTTLLAASTLGGTMNMVNNGTFITEMMSNYEGVPDFDGSTDSMTDHSGTDAVHSLFLSSIFAVIVWQNLSVNAPELLRVSAIGVWFLCFYFMASLYFTDNEPVQDTVFSLLTCAPIIGAVSIFEKTRRMAPGQMQDDARLSIQFMSAFGGVAYFWSCCSPLEVWVAMTELTVLQRVIALFIAVSVLGFITLLLKQCDFMWYGLRRECAVHETDHKVVDSADLQFNEMDLMTLETMKVDIESNSIESQLQPVVVNMEMEETSTAAVAVAEAAGGIKTKRRRRRRRKRTKKAQE